MRLLYPENVFNSNAVIQSIYTDIAWGLAVLHDRIELANDTTADILHSVFFCPHRTEGQLSVFKVQLNTASTRSTLSVTQGDRAAGTSKQGKGNFTPTLLLRD